MNVFRRSGFFMLFTGNKVADGAEDGVGKTENEKSDPGDRGQNVYKENHK